MNGIGRKTLSSKKTKDGEGIQKKKNDQFAFLCMCLLALQYGLQPVFTKKYIGPHVITTTSVLTCELMKLVCCVGLLLGNGLWDATWRNWRLTQALANSAVPAAIYSVQNLLLQLSVKHLDSISFSVFNQSKLLFTALFMFLILRHRQSRMQLVALGLMVVAAVLLTLGQTRGAASPKGKGEDKAESARDILTLGIIPVIAASALSGLGSTLCQLAVQKHGRSSYLMTVEMSGIGALLLLLSLGSSPDGAAVRQQGYFAGWTPATFVPIFLNSVGGILVGLVTQYAGGVKKGFALVSALLITATAQFVIDGNVPSALVWIAIPLVISGSLIHSRFPLIEKAKKP